jgi:hypothetical protein
MLTSAVKLVSAFESARVLDTTYPLLFISYREAFILLGFVEMAFAIFLVREKNSASCLELLAVFGSYVVLYRTAKVAAGISEPCRCLGNVMGWLHLSPNIEHALTLAILAWITAGSFFLLIALTRRSDGASFESTNPQGAAHDGT